MQRVKGQTALVTGAGSGIGRACARALAAEGAHVFVADIDTRGAGETCDAILAAGGDCRPLTLDVTSEADWTAAARDISADSGGLHILVNNAALCIRAGVLEMSLDTWRRQTAVNLDGVFLGCRAMIPLIAGSGGGSVVNIASVAGLKGIAGLSGYCATKGGVRLFTKAVALECAEAHNGVRVNAIFPGSIETPIWVKMLNDGVMPAEGANASAEIMEQTRRISGEVTPLGMAGAPEDIAEGVLYLSSSQARFVTGAELVIDGGVSAG